MLWLLLLQVAEPIAEPPADPIKDLRGTVVEAIRDCGMKGGVIVACAPDRGYSEREARLQKLKKPKPVTTGPAVTVTVRSSTTDGARPK